MSSRTYETFYAYGKKADGSWKAIPQQCYSKEKAEEVIAEYKRDAKTYPSNYFQYTEYKVMKRTVTTIVGEWEDA